MSTSPPKPPTIWVINQGYDWDYIQHLRIVAAEVLTQDSRDDLTRTVAQAVIDLTDNLFYREHTVNKALSKQRGEPDVVRTIHKLLLPQEGDSDER